MHLCYSIVSPSLPFPCPLYQAKHQCFVQYTFDLPPVPGPALLVLSVHRYQVSCTRLYQIMCHCYSKSPISYHCTKRCIKKKITCTFLPVPGSALLLLQVTCILSLVPGYTLLLLPVACILPPVSCKLSFLLSVWSCPMYQAMHCHYSQSLYLGACTRQCTCYFQSPVLAPCTRQCIVVTLSCLYLAPCTRQCIADTNTSPVPSLLPVCLYPVPVPSDAHLLLPVRPVPVQDNAFLLLPVRLYLAPSMKQFTVVTPFPPVPCPLPGDAPSLLPVLLYL